MSKDSNSLLPVPGLEVKAGRILEKVNRPYLETTLDSSSRGKLRKLNSHIPTLAIQFSDHGRMSDEEELDVTIALNLNHQAELDKKLLVLYQPGHPDYHRFLSSEEFLKKYSPTQSQINRVIAFLKNQKVKTTSVSENRLLIRAKGSVKSLNSVAHTEIHRYQSQDGQTYFAPAYEFQISKKLSIQAVHGLQNITHFRSYSRRLTGHSKAFLNSAELKIGLSPEEIRKAYQIPSSVDGSGQSLALFELDGYRLSDVTAYEDRFGLPAVPLHTVLVGDASGSAGRGASEVTLDIELMIAVAPGSQGIHIYEGSNSQQGVLDTYSKIANDNLARQVSTSWGAPEIESSSSFAETENNIFKQMAAQGQTIYAASGDSGAYDNKISLSVDDPSSQPFMVAVGGTRLTTHFDGTYESEKTWNHDNDAAHGAGGGGVSTRWTVPDWQQGLATSQNLGSITMRNTPDVALNADPHTGYAIYSGGVWGSYGGTSCAAPLWAAFTALINQQRTSNGLAAIGFLNPTLYRIGNSERYLSDFFDIADGSTNIYYPAVKGYDNATGWGSFKGQNLFEDLSQDGPKSSLIVL